MGVVRGNRVTRTKVLRSRQLRQSMTPAEATLWTLLRPLRADGLVFRRQHVIAGFIVDFFCPTGGLVIEIDGSVHNEQVSEDRERQQSLEAQGFRVIRFTNDAILNDTDRVLASVIITAAAQRTSPPLQPQRERGSGGEDTP